MLKKEKLVALPRSSLLVFSLIFTLSLSPSSPVQAQVIHEVHHEVPGSSLFLEIRSLLKDHQEKSLSKNILKLAVKKGDSLRSILKQLKINQEDIDEVLSTFKRLGPHQNINNDLNEYDLEDEEGRPSSLSKQFSAVIEFFPDVINRSKNRLYSLFLKTPNDTQITIQRNHKVETKSTLEDLQKDITYEKKMVLSKTLIQEDIQKIITDLKLNLEQARELFQVLSFDVDFEREIKIGQQLEIVTEQFYLLNGEYSHTGRILYIFLELEGRSLKLFRHELTDGQIGFFNQDGQSIKHTLMKTPIPSAMISSNFGMRFHPISDYTRLHKGVDFRASKGTPILAAGDGEVIFKGRKKGYGNYLIIKHNERLQTAYAHISKFQPRLRVGHQVKQGDIVAFVGSTGRATGPHLHYEVILDREKINPIEYTSSSLEGLNPNEQDKFEYNKEKVENFLEEQEASSDN